MVKIKEAENMICDKDIKNRLKRAYGQLNGVITMVDNDQECVNILNQLKAIRSSIDKAIGLLTAQNLIQTIEKNLDLKLENVNEAIDLIVKGK